MALAISLVAPADTSAPRAKPSAAEIVDRNVAARGGLQAWRAVETLSLAGKMGAGGNQRAALAVRIPYANADRRQALLPKRPAEEARLPFLLELNRPHKQRYGGGTQDCLHADGARWSLVDYAAKGTQVELAGMEKVEGRDTYELKLTLKNGRAIHVWIDAETFLETKMEGTPRRLDGTDHPVELYFRDYRPVSGVQIPFVLETHVLPVARTATGLRDTPVPVV